MKKEFRVRKNEEFSRIISLRHSMASGCFVVYSSPKLENHSRVGLSVSKKLGNAVVRNKIKRQIRMMVMNCVNFNECPCDLIVIARQGYLSKNFCELQKDLEKLVKKVIIKKYE